MMDQDSSLNIIFLSTFEALRMPRDKITRQPIEVLGFDGNSTYTLSFVNLDLTRKPMRIKNQFHVIKPLPHIICYRDPYTHCHKAVPTSYHQCLKAA